MFDAQPLGFFDQTRPICMELFPDFAIALATVGQSDDIAFLQFRIERSEIAQLACDPGR